MAPRKPKRKGASRGPPGALGQATNATTGPPKDEADALTASVPQESSSSVPPAVTTRSRHPTQLQSLHPWEGAGFGKPEPGKILYTSSTMASRSRPRGGQPRDNSLDAHEETNMWNKIMQDLRDKAKPNNDRQRELSKQITEMEEAISKKSSPASVAEIDALSTLNREMVRLAEEEQQLLTEEPADIIRNLEILIALKKADEGGAREAPPRQPIINKARNQKKRLDDDLLVSAESPGPSPGVAPEKMNRIKSSGRSQSMSREPKEPAPKTTEDSKNSEMFAVGAEVVYKHNKKNGADGEGYLYTIKAVHGEGPKRRFDVKDPDPDPEDKDAIYRVKQDQLLLIPIEGSILPTFTVGKQVLARYPDTTTFYKAEVMAVKKEVYRLRFEGEEDDKEMDVDKRFVLDDK